MVYGLRPAREHIDESLQLTVSGRSCLFSWAHREQWVNTPVGVAVWMICVR